MITGSQLQGEGPHAERQYMDFIKKVYSICCYTNAQPEDFGTDIIPMACHNRMIDLDRTVQNAEQVCSYFDMDPSKAKHDPLANRAIEQIVFRMLST